MKVVNKVTRITRENTKVYDLTTNTGNFVVGKGMVVAHNCNFHHGESSATSAAVNMAQAWDNNVPLFQGHGNFGSRKIQEAAAARYIYCTLGEAFDKYFADTEVAPKSNDPEDPEPMFYLPVIPWVLVNGVRGIAVGFATSILPRDPKELTKLTKAVIKNKDYKIGIVPPSFPGFRGDIEHVSDLTWKIKGKVQEEGAFYYKITEVPFGEDRAGYIGILNDLCDRGIINDYDDNCSDDGFEFLVKVSRMQKEEIKAKDPMKVFKLERQVTENLTMIGHDGKIKIFDTVEAVIKYFVAYRITKVAEGIALDIKSAEYDLEVATNKMKFISHCVDGKIKISKIKKDELLDYISVNITESEYGRGFIHIPIYALTEDSISDLKETIKKIETRIEEFKSETPETRYLSML